MKRSLRIGLAAAFPIFALQGCSTGADSSVSLEAAEMAKIASTQQYREDMQTSSWLVFVGCQGKLQIPSNLAEQNFDLISECASAETTRIALEGRSRLQEGLLKPEDASSFALNAACRFAQNYSERAAALTPDELIKSVRTETLSRWPVVVNKQEP